MIDQVSADVAWQVAPGRCEGQQERVSLLHRPVGMRAVQQAVVEENGVTGAKRERLLQGKVAERRVRRIKIAGLLAVCFGKKRMDRACHTRDDETQGRACRRDLCRA